MGSQGATVEVGGRREVGLCVLGYIFLAEKESKGPSMAITNHHDRKCRHFAGIFNPITTACKKMALVVGEIANLSIFNLADVNTIKFMETVDWGKEQAY